MSRRDDIVLALRQVYGTGLDGLTPEQLADAYRAETITALAEEASRRLSAGTSRTVSKDAVLRFLNLEASVARAATGKSSRTTADATPDFFQAGHAYSSSRHGDLRFTCLALSADPDSGEQQAIGWRFGPFRNGSRPHRLAALTAEDWACCDWTDSTTTTGKDGAL